MRKLLLVLMLLTGLASAQLFHSATLEGNNTYAGTNIFNGPIQFNGLATWPNGIAVGVFNFVNLLIASSDGTIVYCPDCTTTIPCAQGVSFANGGTDGAFALRVNASWVCSANGTSNFPNAPVFSGLTVNGTSFSNQSGNGADTNVSQRATDSSSTGTFYRCRNHAGNADLCMIDANGVIWAKNLLIDSTLPRFAIPIANGGGGTTYKLLAKTAGGVLVTCLTTDTAIPCWPIDTTLTYNGTTYCAPGSSGPACVVRSGHTTVTFDAGGATDGDWIGTSTTLAGKGKDLGATLPAGPICVIGRAVGATAGNADGTISINQFCYPASSAGGDTVLSGGTETVATPSGTQFVCANGLAGSGTCLVGSSATVEYVIPRAGTADALYVLLSAAEGGAATLAVTVNVNGSDTAITCTVPNAGTTCNDTGHTAAFNAGDRISVKTVQSGTGTSQLIKVGVGFH